tara:strand:- start:209 stop:1108 length:900 start_codon:yes stop_codon:yes gene_type:complete
MKAIPLKLLITGASGNIGTILGTRLQKNNIPFIGLDITNQDPTNNNFFQLDITDKNNFYRNKSDLNDVDTLIHLASKIDAGADVTNTGIESVNVNIKGTLNLLEHLPNLKNILFTSTYMVYGIPQQNPVAENHIQEPHTVYGTSKVVAEKYLQIYAQEKGIDLTIFRYMGIYGLMSHYASQAIPIFIKLIASGKSPIIYGNGLQRRNHLFIDDAIDAILVWINNKNPGVFNIGGADSPTNLDLISIINESMDKRLKPVFKKSEQYDFITDISKAVSVLHFQPKTRIKDGLSRTIEKFLE